MLAKRRFLHTFCYHRDGAGSAGGTLCKGKSSSMETSGLPIGSRRNEDIALDLMKFVAMTTGYGKTAGSGGGVGFQGGGAAAKPEDYADHLLELYGKCLKSVGGK